MSHHPTFFGRSLDSALWNAASALGRESSTLEYRTERLEDGQVKVEILDAPEVDGDPPAPPKLEVPIAAPGADPNAGKEVRTVAGEVPAIPDGLAPEELAKVVLQELLDRIGTKATITSRVTDEAVRIELSDCDETLLLGQDARVLDSLQYLVGRIVQHKERGGPIVFIDVQGRREERAKRLADMAQRLADKVGEVGASIAVQAATSADRRVIHHALSERRDVQTASEGAGAFRALVISPAGRR